MTHQAVDTSGIDVPEQGQRAAADPGTAEPPAGSGFLGRAQELKDLRADIERAGLNTLAGRKAPHARVLLIAGQPGSGRTALAEEFVRLVAHRYPDGVLRARLTDPDGTPVPAARAARDLLGALRLPAAPGADADELTGDLRDALATRRVLLLLDDATGAEQVDPLLPDAPESLVLAVSEGPLTGVSDVRPCTLGGLDAASALRLLSRFTGSVRITCDPRAAEELVAQCGRVPAALTLAGGWLAARPEAAVADLAHRLANEPAQGEPTALSRVFRLVYADLPEATARLLRLLSLAPAGLVDPQTASALAGCLVPAARTALDGLTALGLVRRLDSPLPQYEVPGCLLPLLRRRTGAQDRPAELQLARARMLERTVRLLQSCRTAAEPDGSPARRKLDDLPSSMRFPNRAAAGRWLVIRRPALLAAAGTAVADGDLDTLARRLMAALVRALAAHQGTEAAAADLYGVHELVLDVARRQGLPREQAAALLNLADLDARTGRPVLALARYRSALDAGRRAGDPYATGRAMESLGATHQTLGDFQRAADWFGRALAQRLARKERADAARLYGRIASAHAHQGLAEEAMRGWRAAVAGYRKAGDVAGQARALGELARVQEHAERHEESLHTCREAVERARQARDEHLQAALHRQLADTYDRLGDPTAADLHRTAADRTLSRQPRTARAVETPPGIRGVPGIPGPAHPEDSQAPAPCAPEPGLAAGATAGDTSPDETAAEPTDGPAAPTPGGSPAVERPAETLPTETLPTETRPAGTHPPENQPRRERPAGEPPVEGPAAEGPAG